MRSRIILLTLIFGVWVGLKALDEFVTGPEVLTLLAIACVLMLGHSIWLLIAQGHWRLKTRRHARKRLAQEALASQMNVQFVDEKSSWTRVAISIAIDWRFVLALVILVLALLVK